jgi:hypothetical protein
LKRRDLIWREKFKKLKKELMSRKEKLIRKRNMLKLILLERIEKRR